MVVGSQGQDFPDFFFVDRRSRTVLKYGYEKRLLSPSMAWRWMGMGMPWGEGSVIRNSKHPKLTWGGERGVLEPPVDANLRLTVQPGVAGGM